MNRPGTHHKAPNAMSKFPRKTDEEESDPVNEDIPTLDMKSTGNKYRAPIMFLSRDSALNIIETKMIEAQVQDLYYWNTRKVMTTKQAGFYSETGPHCRASPLDGSV